MRVAVMQNTFCNTSGLCITRFGIVPEVLGATEALWQTTILPSGKNGLIIVKGHAPEFSVNPGIPYGPGKVAVLTRETRC